MGYLGSIERVGEQEEEGALVWEEGEEVAEKGRCC